MGQGIYLGRLVEFSSIFLNLALFIWDGYVVEANHVGQVLFFDIFYAH